MIKAYKGFNNKLQCTPAGKNFQYEVGKEYEEPDADLCNSGFHACENPLDVFNYYSPAGSRFCEVELDGVSEETIDDTKRCGKKIKISAEIGLKGLIDAGVKFIFEKVDWDNAKVSNTGDYSAASNAGYQSAASNTGDHSAASNTGYQSAASNTGDHSAASNTGNRSAASNTGDYSAASNTGYQSAASNTGDQSAASNTGNRSAASNTGDYSAASNTGNRSAASVEGKESVALAMGRESKAKGALGCYIVVAEWNQDSNYDWHIKSLKSAKVDGKRIKADTFYMLKDGKFVEIEEEK